MKKHRALYLILSLAVIAALIIFIKINSDEYKIVESTDLSGEKIGGISLMEKYNESDIEKMFGKAIRKTEEKNYYSYEYALQQSVLFLKVDKDNNIISISIDPGDNSLKTNKGITKGSAFADVEKCYGSNFLKKNYRNFMGSGNGYWITYVDKNNRSKITFEFNEHNDEKVSTIILSKY